MKKIYKPLSKLSDEDIKHIIEKGLRPLRSAILSQGRTELKRMLP